MKKVYIVLGKVAGPDDSYDMVRAFTTKEGAQRFINESKLARHKNNPPDFGGGRSYYRGMRGRKYGYYSLEIGEVEIESFGNNPNHMGY